MDESKYIEALERIVEEYPDAIKYVPNITDSMWKSAITMEPNQILNHENPTKELCEIAVAKNPNLILNIPNEFKTQKMWDDCVRRMPVLIQHMPNPPEKLCKFVVELNPCNIQYIHSPSENVCILAIKKDFSVIGQIQNQTDNLVYHVLEQAHKHRNNTYRNGYHHDCNEVGMEVYRLIKKRNKMFWETLARFFPETIFYTPASKLKTQEVIEIAIASSPKVIAHIKNQTEKQQLIAVSSSGWAIQYIQNPTQAVCLKAVQQNPLCLNFVGKAHQTNEVCVAAVAGNPKAMKYIRLPKKNWNDDLIFEVTVNTI